MNQDAPGSHPGGSPTAISSSKPPFGRNPKHENWAIRAVSWHLGGFQKTTGPHLSGRQGGFERHRGLSHMVRSTLPPLRLSGGPQVDRTQPVTMRRQTLKNRHILLTPIEPGSLGAPVKQVEIQLRFPPASHARVVSAIATPEPKFEKIKNWSGNGAKPSPPDPESRIRRPRRDSRPQITGHRILDLCRICASGRARIHQKNALGVISILVILLPVCSFCSPRSISARGPAKFGRILVEN